METTTSAATRHDDTDRTDLSIEGHEGEHALAAVLTISELAGYLRVPIQTIYDLRSQGRGPHGFRVGRELRFRISEIEAWLSGQERADAVRHPGPSHP